jgi:hypothetical protein
LSALLTVVLASTSFAQQAQTRDGFWIGAGLGYGSMGMSCEGCGDVDRVGAPSGYLKLGTTLRQNILLGVETNAWTKSELGIRLTMANISALDAGGGGTNGFGILGGVGYDVRMSKNLSITPVANWFRGGFDGGSANVLQIGVGVTSH